MKEIQSPSETNEIEAIRHWLFHTSSWKSPGLVDFLGSDNSAKRMIYRNFSIP